jgi:hypothetical protein
MNNKRLKPRELTPEELEEKEIQEEVFLETHGMTREEYEAQQRELIREIQHCEHLAENEEARREYYRELRQDEDEDLGITTSCCPDPCVRGGRCENCGEYIADESDLHQGDNEG